MLDPLRFLVQRLLTRGISPPALFELIQNEQHKQRQRRTKESKYAHENISKEHCPSYLTIDDGGDLHINTSVFRRGTLPKKDGLGAYQKIYIEAVRNLYRATPVSNHKQLGYIFLMLPYINIQYNVLCKNPYESDIAEIEPLTVREFCELIGHSYSTVARLREAYSRIRFEIDGQQELFCAFVYDGSSLDDARIFVNPHVFYSGTDPERVEVLGHFCKSP